MLKFATTQIIAARLGGIDRQLKTAHRADFRYEARPGYLYVRSRAISSRTNDNHDEFPAAEIAAAYQSFVGKPVFVNHVNDNHRRARGVIIDAALHEDTNPDGTPDTWAEVLMELDAVRFPKLAAAILDGEIDRTSMGCDVARSVCSACGNEATTPAEYCAHIPRLKGKRIFRTTASGRRVGDLVRETCYGLSFFENSILVEPPADPTAHFLGVDATGLGKKSTRTREPEQHTGQASPRSFSAPMHVPASGIADIAHISGDGTIRSTAYGEVKAPQDVDTLREENCPVCGDRDTYDGQACQVCGFISPPGQFRDPDLDAAKRMDLRKQIVDPSLIDDNGSLERVEDSGAASVEQGGGQVVNPDQLDENGLPASPYGDQALDGTQQGGPAVSDRDGDGLIQPDEIDPDGNVAVDGADPEQGGQAAPRELPYRAQDHTGDPFTAGPDMPGVPDEPQGPDALLEQDDQGPGTDTEGLPQPVPATGQPGDGVADLLCPSCGFSADATPPQTQNMGQPGADGIVAGDVCPQCQKAQLLTAGELDGAAAPPPPAMGPRL